MVQRMMLRRAKQYIIFTLLADVQGGAEESC